MVRKKIGRKERRSKKFDAQKGRALEKFQIVQMHFLKEGWMMVSWLSAQTYKELVG